MKRNIVIVLTIALSSLNSWGQILEEKQDPFRRERESVTIHRAGSEVRDWKIFAYASPFRDSDPRRDASYQEFLSASSLYHMGHASALEALGSLVITYPTSLEKSEAHLEHATLALHQKAYGKALELLDQVNENALGEEARTEWLVKTAYALAMTSGNDYASADQLFQLASQQPNRWGRVAQLYIASLKLFDRKTDEAAQIFKDLVRVPELSLEARVGLVGVYYAREQYEQVISDYPNITRLYPEARQHATLLSWVARAYYRTNQPHEAIAYLDAIPTASLTTIDRLLFGITYTDTQQYDKAVEYLRPLVESQAEIAATANLFLGRSLQKLGEYSQAVASYEIAAEPTAPASIRESAMYEMALLLRNSQQGHFGQEIRITEKFIDEFPQSPYRNVMSQLLEEFYLSNTSHEVALQSIQRLQQPTPAILSIQKYLLNSQAHELLKQGKRQDALARLQQALKISVKDSQNDAESYLLRSQIALEEKRYPSAIEDLKKYLSLGNPANRSTALYSLGYAYFSSTQYPLARTTFTEALNQKQDPLPSNLQADTWVRLGDCWYMEYQFDKAEPCYRKAYEIYPEGNVYALYKQSDIKGLKKQYGEQIAILKRLIDRYPDNPYVAQSLYDMGRAYILSGKPALAEGVFEQLIAQKSSTYFGRNALLQSALLAYNSGQEEKAIGLYQALIRKFPQTEEAEIAYNSIRSIYMEDGRGDEFIELSRSLGSGYSLNADETKKVLFNSVEHAYLSHAPNTMELIERFIAAYPLSKEIFSVYMYKADLFWQKKNEDEAIVAYQYLFEHRDALPANDLFVVCDRLAQLARKRQDRATSLKVYQTWASLEAKPEIRMGYFLEAASDALQLGDAKAVEALTQEALTASGSDVEMQEKIRLVRAQGFLMQGQKDAALELLAKIFQRDISSDEGSQAVVLWAEQLKGDAQSRKKASEQLNKLIEKGSQNSYWLARGIIALADNYILSGQKTTALQYLKSLQKNYPTSSDDIQEMIRLRLQ